MAPVPARLGWVACGAALVAWLGAILAIAAFSRFGPRLVVGMDQQLGDVVMNEGIRAEAAKDYGPAIESYERALRNHFTHPGNRTETLMRLGNLLLWQKGADQGLPYLEEAYNQGNYTLWLYEPLCQALLGVGRVAEAVEHAKAWAKQAAGSQNPELESRARAFQDRAYVQAAAAMEKAGKASDAITLYKQGLGAPNLDAETRADILVRLGILLLAEEGPGEALPSLQEAYESGHASAWLYEPLCVALLETGQREKAFQVTKDLWNAGAQTKDAEKQALAKLVEGKLYEKLGDKTLALQAYCAGSDAKQGGLNAYHAGVLYYDTGDKEKTLHYLDLYLRDGSGETANWAREIRGRIAASAVQPASSQ